MRPQGAQSGPNAALEEEVQVWEAHRKQILRTSKDAELREAKLRQKRDALLAGIGNVLDEDVPVSSDERDNKLIRTWAD